MKQKIVISALLVLPFLSCKKQDNNLLPSTPGSATAINNARSAPEGADMRDYLFYEGNSEMTTINNNMYLYMSGMKYVFDEKPETLSQLFSKVKTEYQNGLFLKNFINGSGDCASEFNHQVYAEAPSRGEEENHSLELAREMTYKNIGYDPIINLYNAERAELDGEYYLALLVEINEAEDEVGHEYIPAWHVASDGSKRLELLDYYDAYYQSIPVFLFAYEPNNDYEYLGGRILAPEPNESDPETYHPLGRWNVDPSNPSHPYSPPIRTGGVTGGSSIPTPGSVVQESANLYAHHEQYFDSEFYMCTRVSYIGGTSNWSLERKLGKVPRAVIDCGCYYDLDDIEYISDVNTGTTFSFLAYEYDGWATFKHYSDPGSPVVFDFRASCNTDVYDYTVNASTAVEFPAALSFKDYTNGPAKHTFRRY